MPAGSVSARLSVVGESLVDLVHEHGGGSTTSPGGSPMNVAIGLARLGVPTLLVTTLGDDPHGRLVADHVRDSGAELSPGSVRTGGETSTAVARIGPDNAARYEFDLTWDLPDQPLPDATGLHIGSLGASLPPGRDTVLGMARRAGAEGRFVSYDPNIRPAFVDDPATAWRGVAGSAALSTLVKVSDEDLDLLRPGEPVTALARELLASGRTELVIVTRGGAGATAFTDQAVAEVSSPATEVVDTVGAGDSFMAAVLAVLWHWQVPSAAPGALASLETAHLSELLTAAGAAAAVTCSRSGADPPWRRELPAGWLPERR